MPMANQANDSDSLFVSTWPKDHVSDEAQFIHYDRASSNEL